ncbi:hypothetical protein OTU49_014998 [Cherax quadricarinatus]|uniref:RING-type domain-containing protein n=1 Tax=Cherax quadricarinatus TaxID=27406 RepID=A0AAW0Y3Y7_CHEQU
MENSTCGVCSLTYDTEQHVPLVMKCGHDYCRQCLQKLVKKESLTCPFPACRARYEKLNMSELTKVLGLIPKTKIPVPRIVSPTTDTSIQVKINDLDGITVGIKTSPEETLSDLKKRLEAKYGSIPASTRILFRGTLVKDDSTMAQIGMKEGYTLTVSTSYLGGVEKLHFTRPRAKCTLITGMTPDVLY